MTYFFGISNFLEAIPSLAHNIVFLHFFALITEEGFLISYLFPILFPKNRLTILQNAAFRCLYIPFSPLPFTSLLFSALCKASLENHFAFLHFFSLGMVSITASCTMSQTCIHSSSGTLSIRSSPLTLFVTSTI